MKILTKIKEKIHGSKFGFHTGWSISLMAKYNLFFFLLLLKLFGLFAQKKSDQIYISLLTVSPGNELYSSFGHSAIRIQNDSIGYDYVFNYGVFDFGTPNFYLKFIRGKLNYMLGVSHFDLFSRHYRETNRGIIENEMLLNSKQKQQLITFLFTNSLPENREYKYDFFYDNCATRIRDAIENEFTKDLEIPKVETENNLTLRKLVKKYLKEKKWSEFGIDLALGQPADAPANFENMMFLPDYLQAHLSEFSLKSKQNKPLFGKEKTIISKFPPKPYWKWFTPFNLFLFLFFIAILISVFFRYKLPFNLFYLIYFLGMALAGLLIFLLWFATDHLATKMNYNLIWMNPVYFLYFFKSTRKLFSILVFTMCSVFLFSWFWLPQQFNFAFIPMIGVCLLGVVFVRRSQIKK